MWDDNYDKRCEIEEDPCEVKRLSEELPKPESVTDEHHRKMAKLVELQETARKIGITPERLLEMREYTKMIKKKYPHMKPDRLQRKVAEYFKVKLT